MFWLIASEILVCGVVLGATLGQKVMAGNVEWDKTDHLMVSRIRKIINRKQKQRRAGAVKSP